MLCNKLMNKIGSNPVFIFPSKIVGGHELMTLEIIKDLKLLNVSVTVVCNIINIRLRELLIDLDVPIIDSPFDQPRFEVFHAFFNTEILNKAKKILKELNTIHSSIILAQGDIELGSIYIRAANFEKIEIISYIPYTHSSQLMGKKISFLRDILNLKLYKLNNNYITIYNDAEAKLKLFNSNANVYILRNKVRNLEVFNNKREEFFKNNKNEFMRIFVIGRLFVKHKGHDRLIKSLSLMPDNVIKKIELNIVGDGPDFKFIEKTLKQRCPTLKVIFHGWHSEPWELAYTADLLVIPSRFEGVPLVMLEALELNIDVVATARDGMLDYLPKENLFLNECELAHLIEIRATKN